MSRPKFLLFYRTYIYIYIVYIYVYILIYILAPSVLGILDTRKNKNILILDTWKKRRKILLILEGVVKQEGEEKQLGRRKRKES